MAAPFKAYDVRGIYGQEVTEDLAYKVGRAYVDYAGAKSVVVCRDMRDSSVPLSEALIQGLTDQGANVFDLGLGSTDMMYFAVIHLQADGGVMVTASHNPSKYNGLKLVKRDAIPIGLESGLDQIEKIVRQESFKQPAKHHGRVEPKYLLNEFISFMHSFVDPKKLRPLNVVIDAGNGMGGYVVPKLLEGSPLKLTSMFFELDGNFPNHEANPLLEENRVDMVKKVREIGADIGIGLDGDTDRAFFVDDKGEFCSGDFILGLLAKEFMKAKRDALIVYDARCSHYVKNTVEKLGGSTRMWKVGHAPAKNFMREINADFGGEVSGHYYYKYKNAYFDSGNLTFLLLLKLLSDNDQTLSQAMAETKAYHISGEINSTVKDQNAKIEEIKNLYKSKAEIIEIDGINIMAKDWWANVRLSNTEPLLRLNCESRDKATMERVRDEFLALIRK